MKGCGLHWLGDFTEGLADDFHEFGQSPLFFCGNGYRGLIGGPALVS